MLGQYTKTTISDYLNKMSWTECDAPLHSTKIIIDLKAIYMNCVLEYVNDTTSVLSIIKDFIKENTKNYFYHKMVQYLLEIQHTFKLTIVTKDVSQTDSEKYIDNKPNIKHVSFKDFDQLVHFKNEIITYLIKSDDIFFEIQKNIVESFKDTEIIFPKLNDKSMVCASFLSVPTITYDAQVLMFGNPVIYKYFRGQWYSKTREGFKDSLKMHDDDFLYSCILLGTKYAKRGPGIKITNIRKIKDKKRAAYEMLTREGREDILDYINKLVSSGIR
jgi:hypothetical protein